MEPGGEEQEVWRQARRSWEGRTHQRRKRQVWETEDDGEGDAVARAVEEGARGQGESRTGVSRGTGLWGKTPSLEAQLRGMTGRLRGAHV